MKGEKRAVERWEKAKKERKVDEKIISTVEKINSLDNFYTTSSCAGRTVITERQGNNKKKHRFLGKWHRKITKEEVLSSLKKTEEGEIWFKTEPFIFHICAENIKDAGKMVKTGKQIGLKKSGIFQIENRIMLQLIGEDRLKAPLGNDDEFIGDKNHISFLVEKANQKLQNNFERLEKLEKGISEKFSA